MFGQLVDDDVSISLGQGFVTSAIQLDPVEKLICGCHGTLKVQLFPPSDSHRLYPLNTKLSAVPPFLETTEHDIVDAFGLQMYSDASPVEIVLNKGEILYVP